MYGVPFVGHCLDKMKQKLYVHTLGLPVRHMYVLSRSIIILQPPGVVVRYFTGAPGSGPIFLSNLMCEGNEKTLLECTTSLIGLHSCDHTQDVWVECRGNKYIVDASIHMYITDLLIFRY